MVTVTKKDEVWIGFRAAIRTGADNVNVVVEWI